jgi:UDP-GlcNAc:undecaprenyl-phosphate GlcNAc-1-phosphate transferase
MGDAGSQFLGFMTAGLAVVLTQHLDPALNPALVLLILGLPILDTLCVVIWRVRRGESPFRPDRRHFHHRLLDLGFRHYEAVATIYLVHGLLVLTALLVRFEGDAVVVGICLFASAAIIVFFRWARVSDWMLRPLPDPATARERRNVALRRLDWLPRASALTVQLALGAFMLLAGIAPLADRSVEEQRLLAMLSLPLGIMLLLTLGFGGRWRHALRRLLLYASGLLVAYMLSDVLAASLLVNGLVLLIALAVVVAVRVTRRDQFSTTPLDVLILLFVVVFLLVNAGAEGGFAASGVDDVARLVVLFYAIELLLSKGDRYLHLLSALTGTGLLVLGMRAVLG